MHIEGYVIKRIGLIVDEWGSWYDVEPGNNPAFLYQQNTMRDAMIAGVILNIFNKHSDRVHMANIAQLANVLQSIILTDGPEIILTPTYNIFDMYKQHMGNTLLDSFLDTKILENGRESIPMLHESASISEAGDVFITLCNLSLDETANIDAEVSGKASRHVTSRILTNDVHAQYF